VIILGHVEVAPLVPAQIAVLAAVAVVVAAPRLLPARPPAVRSAPTRPCLGVLGVLGLAATVWLAAVGEHRRVLAGAWLVLALASVVAGPWWRAANPLRLLADPGKDRATPEGWWPGAVSLAVLLWVSAAPLASTVVVGVLLVYLVIQLLLGLAYGGAWFARGDGIEALSNALGERLDARVLLAVPAGIALQSQVVRTGVWRDLIAGLAHPWWLLPEAGLAVVLIAAFVLLGLGLRPVAVGYLAAWAFTVLLPVPPVITPDPTALQVAETLIAAFAPPLVVLATHAWAARSLGRLSPALAASAVAGTLLLGPW
jgi:hypothetical protein